MAHRLAHTSGASAIAARPVARLPQAARADHGKILIDGTTRRAVAQLALDHRIRLDELAETSRTLEDVLLDLTSGSAEFASA